VLCGIYRDHNVDQGAGGRGGEEQVREEAVFQIRAIKQVEFDTTKRTGPNPALEERRRWVKIAAKL
jgi:hypothetical protein